MTAAWTMRLHVADQVRRVRSVSKGIARSASAGVSEPHCAIRYTLGLSRHSRTFVAFRQAHTTTERVVSGYSLRASGQVIAVKSRLSNNPELRQRTSLHRSSTMHPQAADRMGLPTAGKRGVERSMVQFVNVFASQLDELAEFSAIESRRQVNIVSPATKSHRDGRNGVSISSQAHLDSNATS